MTMMLRETSHARADGLSRAVAGLLEPGALPSLTEPPELVQTHISWIVLAGPFVYKFKKPLNLGFLDYSTLEKRTQACHREVELNRRLCPTVYLGVVSVREHAGRVAIGGQGRLLEEAVWMRRLPQERMLDELLRQSQARPEMVEAIADRLAAFHAVAATGSGVNEYGTPAAVLANAEENFTQAWPFVGRTLDEPTWRAVRDATLGFLRGHRSLFEYRVVRGRVRDGHGDLHAGSICLTEPIAIFDCIEFNDRFRCGEVASEVAFLAMDLEYNGRADLATAFVERYVAASGDRQLRLMLDFYLCYRAYVRGKVESFKLDEPGFSSAECATVEERARRYFALARCYASRLAPAP